MRIRALVPLLTGLLGCAAGLAIGLSLRKSTPDPVPTVVSPVLVPHSDSGPVSRTREAVSAAGRAAGVSAQPIANPAELLGLLKRTRGLDQYGPAALVGLLPRLQATEISRIPGMLDALMPSESTIRAPRVMEFEGQLIEIIIPDEATRATAAACLFLRWFAEKPEAAVRYGLARPGLLGEGSMLLRLGLAHLDPDQAREALASMPEDSRERMQLSGVLTLAEGRKDPASTLRRMSEDELRGPNMPEIVSLWAEQDPTAAAAWAAGLKDQTLVPYVHTDIARRLARKDLVAACNWLAGLPEGDLRYQSTKVIEELVLEKFSNTSEAAAALAAMDARTADLMRVALLGKEPANPEGAENPARVKDDFAAAAEVARILQNQPAPAESDSPFHGYNMTLATRLSKSDPPAAAAWAMSLPEGFRTPAVEATAYSWAVADAPGASEWIRSLPAGPEKEAAAVRLINAIQKEDPEHALAWAASLTAPDMAQEMQKGIFKDWLERDLEAAFPVLMKLPEQERRNILAKGIIY